MPEEQSIEQEIAEIVGEVVRRELSNLHIPTDFAVEIKNPPQIPEIPPVDLSGVEKAIKEALVAFSKQKAPIIPKQDFSKLEMLLEEVSDRITDITLPDNGDVLEAILKALDKEPEGIVLDPVTDAVNELKEVLKNKSFGGGAIGPSKYTILDKTGKAINPSISATEGDTVTKGNVIMGKDALNQAGFVGLTGKERDQIKSTEQNSHLLSDILDQLKIMNKQLSLITEVEIEDHEVS